LPARSDMAPSELSGSTQRSDSPGICCSEKVFAKGSLLNLCHPIPPECCGMRRGKRSDLVTYCLASNGYLRGEDAIWNVLYKYPRVRWKLIPEAEVPARFDLKDLAYEKEYDLGPFSYKVAMPGRAKSLYQPKNSADSSIRSRDKVSRVGKEWQTNWVIANRERIAPRSQNDWIRSQRLVSCCSRVWWSDQLHRICTPIPDACCGGAKILGRRTYKVIECLVNLWEEGGTRVTNAEIWRVLYENFGIRWKRDDTAPLQVIPPPRGGWQDMLMP